MKNLKKVLALVLVVATLMTMTTIASAKFTDASDIEYTEAVDVMEMIGVINGYTDGSFKPTDTVSRAEMAKMVTFIIAGGEDVGNLYAGANTFSDCTTNWAKGYIAYANKTGIVAGVGGGKFNPTGDVTGTQAAKMMLCALGYDATAEEYTGTNWSVNVLSDAKAAGLLDGLSSVDMSKAMTREQTAQLMLNALKADMVKYDNGNINISSGDTNITIGGSKAETITNDAGDDYRLAGGDTTKQLCEEYFPDLQLDDAEEDDFGRIGNFWSYKKDGKTVESSVYAAAADYTVVVSESGKSALYWAQEAYSKLNGTGKLLKINGGSAVNVGTTLQVGDIVEIYVDDDDSKAIDSIIVSRYEADVIEEVDTDVKAADAEDGVTAYITFEKAGTINDTDIVGYNAKTYVEDAVVALVEKGGDVIASYIPETKEGAITAYSSTTYTMGGTKYTMVGEIGTNDEIDGSVDFDEGTYKLYLDKNGYILKTEVVEGSVSIDDVFYIASVWSEESKAYNETTTTFYVQVVYLDGTVAEIELASADGLVGTSGSEAKAVNDKITAVMAGEFFFTDTETEVNDDISITLSAWDTTDTDYDTNDVSFTTTDKIKTDDTKVKGYYVNDSTVYVVVEGSGSKLSVTTKTGGLSYTPDVEEGATTDKGYVIYTTENGSNVANYIVIKTSDYSGAETGDYIYVTDASDYVSVSGGKQYTVYDMNGDEVTVVIDDTITADNTFYTYVDTDGVYTDLTPVDGQKDAATYTSYYGTLLTSNAFTDYDAADAVIVDVHDTDDYNKSITTLAAMQTAKKAGYVVTFDAIVDTDDEVVEYIVVTGVVDEDALTVASQPSNREGFMAWFAEETEDGAKAWGNLPTIGIEQSVDGNTITLTGKVDNLLAGTLSEGVLAGVNYQYFNNVTDADSLKAAIEAMSGTNGDVVSVSKAGFVGVNVDGVACVACVFEGTVEDAEGETHTGTFVVSQTKGYTVGEFGFVANGETITVEVDNLFF